MKFLLLSSLAVEGEMTLIRSPATIRPISVATREDVKI